MKKLILLILLIFTTCDQEPKKIQYSYIIGDIPLRCYQKKDTESCFCCHAYRADCHAQNYTAFQFTECRHPRNWNIQLLEVP